MAPYRRHAEGWGDIGKMMDEWLKANARIFRSTHEMSTSAAWRAITSASGCADLGFSRLLHGFYADMGKHDKTVRDCGKFNEVPGRTGFYGYRVTKMGANGEALPVQIRAMGFPARYANYR